MPAHKSYHKTTYRELQARLAKQYSHGKAQFLALNAARTISWTPEMIAAMLREYSLGRSIDFIAEELGISREVLTKELDRRNLPRGRWTKRKPPSAASS